ncbi:MAG: CAP domain-containing protein [Anaerolineae bacterium]|nr:CAP domain-containing protein [Anaerolineae bacterium]
MFKTWNRNNFQQLFLRLTLLGAVILNATVVAERVIAQGSLDKQLFLPLIIKPACPLSLEEQALANLLINDANQQRASLSCHPVLAQVARQRAEDMAQRDYFSHTTPEGYGPNYLVRQAGYVLPSFYSTALDGNNIESIAAGFPTAAATWQQWMGSTPHRTQLLGLNSFFAEQTEYGIGYAFNPNSEYLYYWVVITAKRGP